VAEAYEGDRAGAPLLHVEYGIQAGTTTTTTVLPVTTTTTVPVVTTSTATTTTVLVPTTTTTLPGSVVTVEVRVAASSDDAEESASGSVDLSSSDLELVYDGSNQTVGMRFAGVAIPPGATIVDAYVQFKVDETPSGATSLVIRGQAIGNAPAFTTASRNISSRSRTVASVAWQPAAWPTVGAAGLGQQTPNIAGVIQEVVDGAGWASGNALVVIITGTGERVAEAYEGDRAGAPLLHVEYR